jgi:hypothetical protein
LYTATILGEQWSKRSKNCSYFIIQTGNQLSFYLAKSVQHRNNAVPARLDVQTEGDLLPLRLSQLVLQEVIPLGRHPGTVPYSTEFLAKRKHVVKKHFTLLISPLVFYQALYTILKNIKMFI